MSFYPSFSYLAVKRLFFLLFFSCYILLFVFSHLPYYDICYLRSSFGNEHVNTSSRQSGLCEVGSRIWAMMAEYILFGCLAYLGFFFSAVQSLSAKQQRFRF